MIFTDDVMICREEKREPGEVKLCSADEGKSLKTQMKSDEDALKCQHTVNKKNRRAGVGKAGVSGMTGDLKSEREGGAGAGGGRDHWG